MAVTTTKTNKPINPRGNDQSPKGYNRAALYSGKALDFDGVNDSVNLDGFTMAGDVATIVFYGQFDSTGYAIDINTQRFIIQNHNTFGFRVYNNNVWTAYGDTNRSELNFYAIVSDGTTQRAYYNGHQLGSDETVTALDWSLATQIRLGSDNAGSGSFLNGQLSNFKIFNTALTAAQVADLYNNPEKIVPTGVDESNLKLWLPMQEGAGTTAYDGSSTANDPDLIVNGDFATDSDWTKGTGWTIANGVATHDSSLGPGDLYQDFNLTIGKSYKITIEITATDTTELYFMTDGGDYVEVTGSPIGVHSHVFVADESSHRVGVRGSGNWDGSVDNIKLEGLNFANHGTISGATYVHGVGAPVAQSAVISWNKGANYVKQSENFDNSDWQSLISGVGASLSVTDDYAEAPDGNQTASRIQAVHNGGPGDSYAILSTTASTSTSGSYTSAVWIKSNTGSAQTIAFYTRGSATNTLDITTEWARYDIEGSGSSNYFNFGARSSTGTTQNCDFLVWGASINYGTELDSYVPTYGSGQESDVLLPQGLTSGRDITGVNLFENVRKQGALNLDGNSWAEVHDNASLDITDAITLEAWVYNDGSGFDGFLGRYFTTGNNRGVMIYEINNGTARMIVSKDGINTYNAYATISQGWNHIVGTCNDTEIKIYINGVKGTDGTAPSGSIHVSSYPYEIGRYNANITTQHTNQIAQPRIYNRALTAEEVARNYSAGKNTYTNS